MSLVLNYRGLKLRGVFRTRVRDLVVSNIEVFIRTMRVNIVSRAEQQEE